MTYEILPYEVLDFAVADLMEGFSLDPLSEVFCDGDHVNSLAQGCWEFSDDVYPSFHERPWGDDGSELLGWKMCYLGKALVAVAPLDGGDGFRPHGWPIVACSQGSISHVASFRVVAILPFMKVNQDVVSLCRCNVLKVWTGKGSQ